MTEQKRPLPYAVRGFFFLPGVPMRPKQDVIAEYLAEYPEHREVGNRTLARLVMEEYPGILATLEQWRTAVRLYRGNNGGRDRKWAKEPRPNGVAGEYRVCPPSRAKAREPYQLPHGRGLVLPDVHVPYHDVEAIEAALEFAGQADWVLLNGDFIDFHQISRFVSDKDAVPVSVELETAREMLGYLRDRFPDAHMVYKMGNHCERLELYMAQKAPEIADLGCWQLDKILGFEELGIEMVGDKRIVQAGPLNIFHGHELIRGFAPPVNPARGAFLKSGCHALVSHHHKTSEHSETNALGEMISCWSTGCLCDLSPNYAPYGKTNHGFAIVEHDAATFRVHNKRIYRGEVY